MNLIIVASIRFVNKINETFSEIYMRKVKKQKIRSQSVKGEAVLDRLRDVLDQSGMSGRQFAEKIGLKAESATRLFNGVTGLTKPLAYSIELHFGLRSEWLLTGEGDREVPKHSDLSPLERCGLDVLLSHSQKWFHLEHLIFEKHENKIGHNFGALLKKGVDLKKAEKHRKNTLFQLSYIRQVFRELDRDELAILKDKELRVKEKFSEKEKKTRLGQALLLAVHFGDEWESIKEDSLEWSAVVKDGTVEEFDKLHFQINEIRSEIDL